jgi:hypothetical protein
MCREDISCCTEAVPFCQSQMEAFINNKEIVYLRNSGQHFYSIMKIVLYLKTIITKTKKAVSGFALAIYDGWVYFVSGR